MINKNNIQIINDKQISILIRPMHINDVNTIYHVQKEMFPADDLFEEYSAFENKFLVYPQGCWCAELIDNKNNIESSSTTILQYQNYEPSSDLELNKTKLLGHFFSHPWKKGEFPPLNNVKSIREGVDNIIDENGNCKTGITNENTMLYLNEIAVRPMARGFNIARILTNRVLHHLSQQTPSFDHIGLVSVQGSFTVWGSIGFDIDNDLPQHKKEYLIHSYGEGACYMKMDYSHKVLSKKNNQLYTSPDNADISNNNNNNNNINNNNNETLYVYGKLFKELKKVSKL